jgi:UDP-N-acetylmuramoyl-tripeptide--D-alanyl-D-alanine ligase
MNPMMQLHTAMPWLAHATLVGEGATPVLRVHTDTRSVEPGDLFLALKGEKFDANSMLHEASKQGAAALICHAGLPAGSYPPGIPRIEVADTHAALAQLATGWRAQFSLPLIAVTGSNGKTTVTQMIASILAAAAGDDALATRGNLNNEIGVPLTVLRLRAHHRIAVVELGMNHPGEIDALAAIAQPTVALVNNAQREHLEFMQTVQAVAEENGCVIGRLPMAGTAVYPADDAFTPLWAELAAPRRTARFALTATDNAQDLVCQTAQWLDGAWSVQAHGLEGALNFRLHIAGRHNVKNALAAAACALAAGVPQAAVVQGLQAFVPVKGRSRAVALHMAERSRTLVDDTYNANPDSVRAAIAVLAELPAPRLLVLGDMGEVGEQGPAFHAEAGSEAHASGIEHFFALGELARHSVAAFPGARHFASMDALNAAVLQQLPQVNSVLVKGSRFMRMERVVEAVCGAAASGEKS